MAKVLIHIGEKPTWETYEYDRRKLLNVEYGAMERVTGLIGADLEDALNKGGANALTALIWVLRRRTMPRLQFDDVKFELGDLSLEVVNDDGTPLTEDDEDSDEGEPDPEAPKDSES